MEVWQMLVLQALVTGVTVAVVLMLFFRWVIKPYIGKQLVKIQEMTDSVESKVVEGVRLGVKQGVTESLQSLPGTTAKESTRQLLRFGSDLVENGLSSFLGTAEDLKRRSERRRD